MGSSNLFLNVACVYCAIAAIITVLVAPKIKDMQVNPWISLTAVFMVSILWPLTLACVAIMVCAMRGRGK